MQHCKEQQGKFQTSTILKTVNKFKMVIVTQYWLEYEYDIQFGDNSKRRLW